MIRFLLLFLISLVLFSCNSDKTVKEKSNEIERTSHSGVETPEQFRDLVLEALRYNRFYMLDSLIPTRAEIEKSLAPADDSVLKKPGMKDKYNAFIDNVKRLVDTRTKNSFEDAVSAGLKYGIDWQSSSAEFSKEKTAKKFYPGYFIYVTYDMDTARYELKIQADSLSRGFVLGNKIVFSRK